MFDLMNINPGLWVIVAGLICALIPKTQGTHYLRKAILIAAPVFAAWLIFTIKTEPEVLGGILQLGDITLTTMRIDNLSVVWGYLFCLAGLINGIYGLHEKCRLTDSSALIYTGSAIAGVLAGDMITLFIMWEVTAISSVFLVWNSRFFITGCKMLIRKRQLQARLF